MSERCDCHTCQAIREAVGEALADVVERLEARESSVQHGLYRPDEAAAYLGIGRTKLDELVADGALEAVQVGRLRLYPVIELDAFIDRLRSSQRGLRAVR